MHDRRGPPGCRRLSWRMAVATEYKQQVKKAVGRAGHGDLPGNERRAVCGYARLQWMHTGGAVCSPQPPSRQRLEFPGRGAMTRF